MTLFWDKHNDFLEILGDDGKLWGYGEDNVAIARGDEKNGRYWMEMVLGTDTTPFNTPHRYDIFDPKLNNWVAYDDCDKLLVQQTQKEARIIKWKSLNRGISHEQKRVVD